MRESTYQTSVAHEARQMARCEAKRRDAEATTDGSLMDEEYSFLRELVEEANAFPGPIIEIGTLFGLTISKIALWKQPQKKIVTVDNYCWNPLRLSPEMHFHVTSLVLQYPQDAVRQSVEAYYRQLQQGFAIVKSISNNAAAQAGPDRPASRCAQG